MGTDRDDRTPIAMGRVGRRRFVARAFGLGASLASVGLFTAACRGVEAPRPAAQGTSAPAAAPTKPAAAQQAPAQSAAQPTAAAVQPAPVASGPQRLVIAGAKDIRSLDPAQENDADSTYVYSQVHDSVARLDQEFNLKPALAESWDATPDGLTYTYRFRKGVKFHDGSALTADDVVFTIDRILTNTYPEGRKKEKIEMIDSLRKIDDSTVEIKLKYAYAPFPAAFGTQMIVPKAAVERLGDAEFARNPVGAGPFTFVEWVPNDHVTLRGFEDYWLAKPNLSEVVVRPIPENSVAVANLLAGDVDVVSDVVGPNLRQLQAAANRGIQVVSKPGFSYFWAGFRMFSPPFTDLRFRQAVYLASDFDAAIQAIFPAEIGVRAYSCVPPGLWPQDVEYLKGVALKKDQARAKTLFQQLVDEGVMPRDYTVTVAPPPDDARIKVAEVMVTNLKEVGVNAELLRVEWATYSQITREDRNLIFMLGSTPAIPDPDANVRWLFSKESVHGKYLNIEHFKEYPDWDAQITKAQRSADREERTQIYRDLVRTMMQQVVHIPLYHKNAIIAKRDYVKDLDVNLMFEWDLVKPWANVSVAGKKS
jgi:peptide/nickel transport system substrate-binding protein